MSQIETRVNGSHKSADLSERQIVAYCLWLEDLSTEDLASLNERIVFPARLLRLIEQTHQARKVLPGLLDAKPSQIVDVLQDIQAEALYAVRLSAQDEREMSLLDNYCSHYQHISHHTTGADLRALGLEPSPRYEEILHRLKVAWLDGEVQSVEEERALLERLVLDNRHSNQL